MFFTRSFTLVLISISIVLFEVSLVVYYQNLSILQKSVISGISVLLAKFAWVNLVAKSFDDNLLNF